MVLVEVALDENTLIPLDCDEGSVSKDFILECLMILGKTLHPSHKWGSEMSMKLKFEVNGKFKIVDLSSDKIFQFPNDGVASALVLFSWNIKVGWTAPSKVLNTVDVPYYSHIGIDEFRKLACSKFSVDQKEYGLEIADMSLSKPVPTSLTLMKIRDKYSSLTLSQVLWRVDLPKVSEDAFDIKELKSGSSSFDTKRLKSTVDWKLQQIRSWQGTDEHKFNQWHEWLSICVKYLNALHKWYETSSDPKEAPRRIISDVLLIAALDILNNESARFAVDKELYSGNVPNHTIGWGFFDYKIALSMVLKDVSGIGTSEDVSMADLEEGVIYTLNHQFECANLNIDLDVELKRNTSLVDNALAQIIGKM